MPLCRTRCSVLPLPYCVFHSAPLAYVRHSGNTNLTDTPSSRNLQSPIKVQVSNCRSQCCTESHDKRTAQFAALTSHFLYPVFLSFDFEAARLAIFGSLFLTYSCASAAHTFLCVLKCAFWQSLPQYGVVWHLLQALREASNLPH